eukprot:CAMPEP_0178397902 /NCGR_PEP_ID=MMETSP0689_2-20121128/14493_1 /TAXON_ID=160604 /ORGANISM="Amphidinium massartii, Strain CS-259" /LENGTH=76 /DNA_ID=CAMNT_0020018641 /DNA_START=51 /DNA_END=277 /DNA_ORIENTATION=-
MPQGSNESTEVPIPAERSKVSINSLSSLRGKSGRTDRSDSNGVAIQPGSKAHRTTFVDEVSPGTPVAQVKEVQSFG